ncbi:MAG: DUF1338 domain-containing protein [Oligoflexia bacterium]|nr:DUF1338 domain-containing protein [Oligoflexia bacterium]MBF0364721.1 DUF1338 domain-containing protein [Oligoflexia bacterium]
MSYKQLLDHLWSDYSDRNPQAKKIHQLFLSQGEAVQNDHIALRTFNDPRVNIEKLSQFFLDYGFEEKGEYHFTEKKLFAKHFEHQDPLAPRVFISELLTEQFSPRLQKTAKECVDSIPTLLFSSETLLSSGASWMPSYSTYKSLLQESEYAAWMYAFGYCANHFTVNVNALKGFGQLQEVNDFLEKNGFALNLSGGSIKGTPDEYLEQSSTLADKIDVLFKEGTYRIPFCYYEFAKRYPLPNGKLYSGFVATSADKIFESTNSR